MQASSPSFFKPIDFFLQDTRPAASIACFVDMQTRPFPGVLGALDWRLNGFISQCAKREFFSGQFGEMTFIPVTETSLGLKRIFLLGLGTEPLTIASTKSLFGEFQEKLLHAGIQELFLVPSPLLKLAQKEQEAFLKPIKIFWLDPNNEQFTDSPKEDS